MNTPRLDMTGFQLEAKKRGYHLESVFDMFGTLQIKITHILSGWKITINALTFDQAINALHDKRVKPTLEMLSEANAGGPNTNDSPITNKEI
jgi:hypothetical protein